MIVIIGAGPAGLACAHHLEQPSVVLEREAEVGGLCRSFELAGATFDLGGHAFFTRHDPVRALYEQVTPGGLHAQARAAWVSSHDTFVPYPFQANLHGLPVEVVQECLMGAIEAALHPPAVPPTDFGAWVESAFGAGVARHFLRPYNEKLWGHPLRSMVPSWTGERVVQPPLEEMVAGALGRRSYLDVPNATVRYPAGGGGFAAIFDGLAAGLRHPVRRASVVCIDLHERVVVTDDGDGVPFDQLVSTMPPPALVAATPAAPPALRDAVGRLAHNSLVLVQVVVGRERTTERQRVYSAAPDVPFHKLAVNTTSSPALAARGVTGFQGEVSYTGTKPRPADDAAVAATIAALRRLELIAPDDEVVATSTVDVPLAYPVPTHERDAIVASARDFYAGHGVHLVGRFAEWAYINSDEAVHRGVQLARRLDAGATVSP